MKPSAVRLAAGVALNLPRSLIEDYHELTEPSLDLYGARKDGVIDVFNDFNRYKVNRQKNSVEFFFNNDRNLEGFEKALFGTSSFIGQAHGHHSRGWPTLSKADKKLITKNMRRKGMNEWIEVLMYYEKINPSGYKNFEPEKNQGIVYERNDKRPRLRIYNEEENLGIDMTFFAYWINGTQTPIEVPLYFSKRTFKHFSCIL